MQRKPEARKLSIGDTFKEGMSGYFKSAKESLIFAHKVGRIARIGMGLGLPSPDFLVDIKDGVDSVLLSRRKNS